MAVKIVSTGFDAVIKEFEQIAEQSDRICTAALYKGAGSMADRLKDSVNALNTEDRRAHKTSKLLPYEQEALQKGLSIGKFEHDKTRDFVATDITFRGYTNHPTESFPTGMPIRYLARSINAGTSFRSANRFFGNTVRRNAQKVEKEMAETIESELQKLIK